MQARTSAHDRDLHREIFEAAYHEWAEHGNECAPEYHVARDRLWLHLIGTEEGPGLIARYVYARLGEEDEGAKDVVQTVAIDIVLKTKLFAQPPSAVRSYQALALQRAEWRVKDTLRRREREPIDPEVDPDDFPTSEEGDSRFTERLLELAGLARVAEMDCLSALATTSPPPTAPPDVNRFRAALYHGLARAGRGLEEICNDWGRERQSGRRARKAAIDFIRDCLTTKGDALGLSLDERQKLWPRYVEALINEAMYR